MTQRFVALLPIFAAFFSAGSAQAQTLVVERTVYDDMHMPDIATSADGDTLVMVWQGSFDAGDHLILGTMSAVSEDGGQTLTPPTLILEEPSSRYGRFVDATYSYDRGAVALSTDGRRVETLTNLRTDYRIRIPGLGVRYAHSYQMLHHRGELPDPDMEERGVVGAMGDGQAVDASIRDVDLALSADGQALAAVWDAYRHDNNNEGDVFISVGPPSGAPPSPQNLSEVALSSAAGNAFEPKVAVGHNGQDIFVGWRLYENAQHSALVRSTDGGASWDEIEEVREFSEMDLAYAADAERLVVATDDGHHGDDDDPLSMYLWISDDQGESFYPPRPIAHFFETPTGPIEGPIYRPLVKTSADAEVIAVFYQTNDCVLGTVGCWSVFQSMLTVSVDGGQTFLGPVMLGETYFTSTYDFFDMAVSADGSVIYVAGDAVDGTSLWRVRLSRS